MVGSSKLLQPSDLSSTFDSFPSSSASPSSASTSTPPVLTDPLLGALAAPVVESPVGELEGAELEGAELEGGELEGEKAEQSNRGGERQYQHLMEYFVAGGMAGATSRTAVSPLERLKIIQQVQSNASGHASYKGVLPSLAKMWREEGIRGYMKGNGVNCLRIFPYSAVQFTTYETLKQLFTEYEDGEAGEKGKGKLGTGLKLVAGSLAGIASVSSTYPLDLVRSRLSISAAQLQGFKQTGARTKEGIVSMTLKVYRTEGGIRGLYMGMIPTAAGVAPYVALNFVFYEKLRLYFLDDSLAYDYSEGRIALTKLGCGALAGGSSQTITYPFDVIRRKMQVLGLQRSLAPPSLSTSLASAPISLPSPPPTLPHLSLAATSRDFSSVPPTLPPSPSLHQYTYTTGRGAIIQIFHREGLRGLYRGLLPNLLKVAPQMGVSFYTYETVLGLLNRS